MWPFFQNHHQKLVKPRNTYFMVISPKSTPDALVPLLQPGNTQVLIEIFSAENYFMTSLQFVG